MLYIIKKKKEVRRRLAELPSFRKLPEEKKKEEENAKPELSPLSSVTRRYLLAWMTGDTACSGDVALLWVV